MLWETILTIYNKKLNSHISHHKNIDRLNHICSIFSNYALIQTENLTVEGNKTKNMLNLVCVEYCFNL